MECDGACLLKRAVKISLILTPCNLILISINGALIVTPYIIQKIIDFERIEIAHNNSLAQDSLDFDFVS